MQHSSKHKQSAFTIVELLIVIVVIAILATIVIVAYNGIQQKAREAAMQSDLSNSSKQLKLYQATYSSYPTSLDSNNCPLAPIVDADRCLKASGGNTFNYTSDGTSFSLTETNSNGTAYSVTDSTAVTAGAIVTTATLTISAGAGGTVNTGINGTYDIGTSQTITATPSVFHSFSSWSGDTGCSGTASHTITIDANKTCTASFTTDAGWLTIGTQTWATVNLNVGTIISGTTNQTNNSILEKYCYSNTESNCTTYGALYQWNEAMQYVTTAGAQGICPANSHIPTDSELTTLETYLGSATAGTQLKSGGSSGLDVPLAGLRDTNGSFYDLSSYAYLWSSSESSSSALSRFLYSGGATVYPYTYSKGAGFSVRCLGN